MTTCTRGRYRIMNDDKLKLTVRRQPWKVFAKNIEEILHNRNIRSLTCVLLGQIYDVDEEVLIALIKHLSCLKSGDYGYGQPLR